MRIKKYFYSVITLLAFVLTGAKIACAQNVGISSSSGFTPDASAALDVSYTNKGLLIPRVALTANNVAGPISSPATSLLVYNTATAGTSPNNVIPGYYYWNGSAWVNLTASTQNTTASWLTTGNTGTSYPTNYLGTTDNFGQHFKTNAIHRFWIDSLGSVAVGIAPIFSAGVAREKFLVDAGSANFPTTPGAFNVISGKGYLDSYLQLNIQNTSATASASSDIVASNDQGSENANYVDLGINSSAYSNTNNPILAFPGQAYLLATGNDFSIGNSTSGKNLTFFTGGVATTNERMRIDGSGKVGIGTISPTQSLDVAGNINASASIITDGANANTGTVLPGIQLGSASSGEAISSKRTSGTNQYGIDFYTSSNLRMSITNTGSVGIGTNTPAYKLSVAGIVAPTADNTYSLGGGTGNRWTAVYATSGTIQTSDRRLKTNIKNLNYGLKEVLALQPVSYNWKDKSHPENKIGLIAQDVKKVVPEVVSGNEAKEKLGMNYAELVPVLINAVKEQQKQIDELKKEIKKLQIKPVKNSIK